MVLCIAADESRRLQQVFRLSDSECVPVLGIGARHNAPVPT